MRRQNKSIAKRIEMFKEMKNQLLEDFMAGGDPIKIGQLLILVETIEAKDTGSISKLEGQIDITEKELQEKMLAQTQT